MIGLFSNERVARSFKSITYLLICLTLALMPSKAVFADANQLFISPNSSQMNKGTSFTVNVKSYADTEETSGSAVGTVTYPSSKLSVTSISISGSAYGSPSISQGSGTVGFNASRTPAPSGIAQIFSIKFKAIKGGTAVVAFSSSSKVNGATTVYGNGVFTIIDNSPQPSSSPSPSPSKSSTPVPVTSKPDTTNENQTDDQVQTETDSTGLIDNNVVIDALYNSASVSWNATSKKSSSMTFSYGLEPDNLNEKADVKKESATSYSVSLKNLEPGLRYYFTINGKDSKGKPGTYSSAIYTRGYPVVFTITENDLPAENALVTIGSLSRTADQNGKLTIGLAAGDYQGTITTDTASLKISLTVTKKDIPVGGSAPSSQSFPYNLTSSVLDSGPGSNFSILTFIGILIIGTLVLGIAFFMFISYRRRRFESDDSRIVRGTSVVIDDGFNWSAQPPPQNEQQKTLHSDNIQDEPPPAAPIVKKSEPNPTVHDNSVYMNEDEPEDMFERAQHTDYNARPVENNPPTPIMDNENIDESTQNQTDGENANSEETDFDELVEKQTKKTKKTDDSSDEEISISHDSEDETGQNPS